MIRTSIASLITGAFLIGVATAAVAATKGEFGNMCAEGLAMHKEIKTNCSVNADYKGKTYCFGNEQAKKDFMKNPSANLAKAESFYKSLNRG